MIFFKNGWGKYRNRLRISLAAFLLIVVLPYIILFTPLGNRLLQPWIERSLSNTFKTPITLENFELDHRSLRMHFRDRYENSGTLKTTFSLLTLTGDGYYQIDLSSPLLGINRFNTPLQLTGSLNGGYRSLKIQGSLQFHHGALPYRLNLKHFTLESLQLYLNNVDYASLVTLFDIPSDTLTTLNGHILLNGFKKRSIQGSIVLKASTRSFKTVMMDEDDNESFDIAALLADETGFIKRFDINVTSDISLNESGILDPLLGFRSRGPIALKSTLIGNHLQTELKLQSNLANSQTQVKIDFSHLDPVSIRYTISHADLEKLFYFLNMNAPLLGTLTSDGELNTTEGAIALHLNQAQSVPNVLKKEYEITQPFILFNADIHAQITPKAVHYKGFFRSDLRRMEIDTNTSHPQMFRDLLKILP